MIDSVLCWIELHPTLIGAVISILTGAAAILAGYLAFRGAREQAKTALQIHESATREEKARLAFQKLEGTAKYHRKLKDERQAFAGALSAEIVSMILDMKTIIGLVKARDIQTLSSFLEYAAKSHPIFNANPIAVTKFGAVEANRIVVTYTNYSAYITQFTFEVKNNPISNVDKSIILTAEKFMERAMKIVVKLTKVAGIHDQVDWDEWNSVVHNGDLRK